MINILYSLWILVVPGLVGAGRGGGGRRRGRRNSPAKNIRSDRLLPKLLDCVSIQFFSTHRAHQGDKHHSLIILCRERLLQLSSNHYFDDVAPVMWIHLRSFLTQGGEILEEVLWLHPELGNQCSRGIAVR
jgi:hypothetical protein